jgi:hypothetical protein
MLLLGRPSRGLTVTNCFSLGDPLAIRLGFVGVCGLQGAGYTVFGPKGRFGKPKKTLTGPEFPPRWARDCAGRAPRSLKSSMRQNLLEVT